MTTSTLLLTGVLIVGVAVLIHCVLVGCDEAESRWRSLDRRRDA